MSQIWLKRAVVVAGAIFAANGAMADAKWSYADHVLTGIAAEGETAVELNLTEEGVVSVKTAGTQAEIDLRSAALPDGAPEIVKVGDFRALKATLQRVYLPESAKVIASSAFAGCTVLKSVKLPDGLESLEAGVFSGCSALELVEPCIPGSVTNLGTKVFQDCGAMTNDVIIGEGVGLDGKARLVNIAYDTNRRNWSLSGCNKVKRLVYGPGVHNVPTMFCNGSDTFKGIEYIEFGVNVTNFTDNLCMHFQGGWAYKSLTNVVFRRTEEFAFRDSEFGYWTKAFYPFGTSLRELEFNGWITFSPASNPFYYCNNLQLRMTVPGDNVKWAAFMADETKMTPWAKCSESDKAAYTKKFTDGKVPVGISVRQPNGMKRFYIMTNGAEYEGNTIQLGGEMRSEFGTVTYSPSAADGQYEKGTQVTVKFTPANEGVVFKGWRGDVGTADASAAEITVTADGLVYLVPIFEANYLVYDAQKGELTDGNWVMSATGAANEICVTAFKRGVTLPVEIDLNKPVLNGGRITKMTGMGDGVSITSIRLPETLRWLGGLSSGVSSRPQISPLVPDAVTNLAKTTFHEYSAMTGNLRIGFATNEQGKVIETVLGDHAFDYMFKMGPKVEFGPGIRKIPNCLMTQWKNAFGLNYAGGAMEIWFGENVEKSYPGALRNFGGVESGSHVVSVHYAGDMFDGSSGMFLGADDNVEKPTKWYAVRPADYVMRFYVGADGCAKWHEFLESTKGAERKIIPWAELGEVTNEYWTRFPKGEAFGMKHPYGLTTEAAVMTNELPYAYGLPKNQWVFSLRTAGMVIRIR